MAFDKLILLDLLRGLSLGTDPWIDREDLADRVRAAFLISSSSSPSNIRSVERIGYETFDLDQGSAKVRGLVLKETDCLLSM